MDCFSTSAYVRVSEPQVIATANGTANALWVINAGTDDNISSGDVKAPSKRASVAEFVLGSNVFFTMR